MRIAITAHEFKAVRQYLKKTVTLLWEASLKFYLGF